MNSRGFIGGVVACAAFGLALCGEAAEVNIVCSAADTPAELKAKADFVCPADDARRVLQAAIDRSAELQVKCVLLPGTYVINSRGDHCPKGGICFPNLVGRDDASFDFHARQAIFVTLEGLVTPHGVAGTVVKMGRRLYDDIGTNEVFSLFYCDGGKTISRAWTIRNLFVLLPENQKPIVVFDGRYCGALALEHGLHVVSAVPALLGRDQLEYAPKLLDAVKRSGKLYQMNETTAFRAACYEMRKLYEAGAMGEIVYSEGEYWHCSDLKSGLGVGSYLGWREGLPPMYYPTHSTGFYTCVTHKRFTEVTCVGKPSRLDIYRDGGAHNRYANPFGGEFAYLKTEEGGSARMLVSYDIPCVNGERGRVWGQTGGYDDAQLKFLGDEAKLKGLDYRRHQLPKGVSGGGHGGSHGYLTDDFIHAILDPKHRHCVDAVTALNTTVAGIYAHLSALKGGETLKIPGVG